MAFPQSCYLSSEDVDRALATLLSGQPVEVTNIQYKNKQEIRRVVKMSRDELVELIRGCMKEEHQPGGDIEVRLPALGATLVGHHDGVYWLEPSVPGFPRAEGGGCDV